jgi:hypothetical protein
MMKRNADSAAHGKALSNLRKEVEAREEQILVSAQALFGIMRGAPI